MSRATMLLALIILSCSGGGSIEVSDAWARPTPEVADTAALYVSLFNDSGVEDR